MEKYRAVEKPRVEPAIKENEVRVTTTGKMRNFISYATTLFKEKGATEIVLKAMGRAINKTVTIAEIIKRRIVGLHQITIIDSTDITDVWEPLEEGLDRLETTRHVSSITITLSTAPLETSAPGYQPPLPEEEVKEITIPAKPARRPRGRGRGRRTGPPSVHPAQVQQQPQQHQQHQDIGAAGIESNRPPRGRGRGRGRGRPRRRGPRPPVAEGNLQGGAPISYQGGNRNQHGGRNQQGIHPQSFKGPRGGRGFQGGFHAQQQGGNFVQHGGGFYGQQGGNFVQQGGGFGANGEGGRGRGRRPRGRGRGRGLRRGRFPNQSGQE